MDREWTEVEPRMDRSTLATMCRYIALIFAVLVMSIANVGTAWGTEIADLNFNAPTSLPSNYTYSSTNTPGITTFQDVSCVNVSSGGGSTAPNTWSATNAAAPSGGKRWLAFQPAVDCRVTLKVGKGNNDRTFYLMDKDHNSHSSPLSSYNPSDKNVWDESWSVSLTSGTWYAITNAGTGGYIASMQFVANPTFSESAGAELTQNEGTVTLTASGTTIYYEWSTSSSAYAANDGSTFAAAAADGSGTSPVDATAPDGTGTYYLYAVAKRGNYYSDVVKRSYTIVAAAASNTYTYTGQDNSWGSTAMTVSDGGLYEYVHSTRQSDHQFKIKEGSTYYNWTYTYPGFCMTNLTTLGNQDGDNCKVWDTPSSYYIIVFKPNTTLNSSSNPRIATSTTLPDDTEEGLAKTKMVYLVPGSGWETSSPKYAVYYEGHSRGWSDYMTASPCIDGAYQVEIPALFSSVQFMRMNPEGGKSWNDGDYWNYTAMVTMPTNKPKFTVNLTNADWNSASTDGSNWSTVTTYTISFNANKGSGSISSITGIDCNTSRTLPTNTFTRTGWTFVGWNTDKYGGGTSYDDGATINNITSNITLYAQWQRTIYLKVGDGWDAANAWFAIHYWDNSNSTNDDVTMELADGCSNPKVYRATISGGGYDRLLFLRMDPDYNTPSTDAGSGKWNQTENLEFSDTYNQYTITDIDGGYAGGSVGTWGTYSATSKYTITFNAGTGSGSMSPINNICSGADQALTANSFEKTGYDFDAWHANVDVTVSSATVSAGNDIADGATLQSVGSDITLTAQWTAKTTTVTINANTSNHGSTAPSPITATYGSALPSFTAATGASGYSLTGYFTEATSGTKVINADGTLVANTDYADGSGNWKYETSTLTLYAQYEEEVDDCYSVIAEAVLNGTNATSTLAGGTLLAEGLDGSGPYKLNSKPSYFGMKLSNNLQEGDSIIFKVKVGDWWAGAKANNVPIVVFAGKSLDKEIYRTSAIAKATDNYYVRFKVTQTMIDSYGLTDTVMIWRTQTNDPSCTECCTQNHQMYSMQVKHCTPSCSTPSAPTSPTNEATTSNSQAVSWTDASNEKWDVIVSESSSTPDAGDTPTASDLTSKSYTFTGLTASTTYYWWVRSVCDASHKSAWVAGSSFTTSAATYTLTTTVGTSGAATGGATITNGVVASIPAGTMVTNNGDNTFTVNTASPTTVTATASVAGVAGPDDDLCTYAFISWENLPATVTADVSNIHALYEARFTIGFKETDGTAVAGISSTYYVYGTGKEVSTFPTPTKSGYTFAGWYKDDLTSPATDLDNEAYGAIDYYARWTPNQYSVSHSLSYVTATSGATGANAATYGTNYTAVFAADGGYTLPATITVTIGGEEATEDTEYTWDASTGEVTITGSYITGAIVITVTGVEEESCPTGGDVFTLEMTYSGSEVSVAANTVADWSASYGTKDGGDVKFGNVNGSSAGKIKIQANQINLGSNDGYIKLILDCPLKQNDVLSFTSSGNYELCFTTDDSYNNSVKSSSKKWTVPKSFNNVSTIYIWRASSNTNNIYTINIVRPVTVTFDKNGGSSVSPSSATYDGTSSSVLASATRTDYHLDGWNTKSDGSGDDLGLPGETYYLDDVTTSTTTIYAQWLAKSCASGTIYQFTVNTGLTNDNFPKTTEVYVKTSDYLATMTGGYLKAYNSSSDKLKITDNKYICINSSSSYLLVQFDCPLQAGDQIKSTVKSQALYITKGSDSRASTYSLPVADNNVQTIPAAWAGATEIKIWAGSSNGGKIQDFQIIRAASTYSVTYDDNDATSGDAPEDDTDYDYNAEVTVASNSGTLAMTNYSTLAYWNTKEDGSGTDYAIGSGTFNITDNTTLYAKWTQAVTLDKNGGTTAGSATAVWNAKGLTSFTAVVPASGYKCTGYYTTSSGAGTKVLNADGTYASSSVTDYVTSGKWSRTGAAPTLYARYEAGGALTWNLSVNTTATSLTTNSKTSAFTEISTSNMTNAAVTGLTYTGNAKSNLTGKISTPASEDASKYVSVSFQVASGYKFIPSSIKVKVQPISVAQYVKLELKDNAATPNSITYTTASAQSKGSISTVEMTNGEDVEFTGTVTLKIFCYGTAKDVDGYRLGTPITIEGEIQEACATKPSFSSMSYSQTEYTVDDDASAISIVGGTNIDTYAWKQNTVNDRSGGEDADGDSDGDSYTPPTSSAGTMYYWCEMTNTDCGITIKSAAVGVTVSASKTDATITWTDPANTPNFGGGAYTVKATVNETGWNGTAADLSITAPEGIRIYSVTSGTTDSKKWVQATFDVTTSFDRETYSSNIPFTVSHAATSTYNAISDSYDVSYTSCSGGGEGTANIPVLSATHDEGSGNAPRYWWETTGNGRILALSYGKSDCSSTSDATFTSDGFSYVASSTNQRVVFQPYVSGVTKIRVYVKSATNTLTISSIGVNASWKDQSSKYSAISTDTIIYSNDKTTGLDNKDKGYMEVEFSSALTANSYYMITFSSSSVYLYGIKLYSSSAGSGGSLTTTLAFADATVNKNQGDASFTKTASLTTENTNSLGSITYSSSNTSCATVNATTGEVTITATGSSNLSTKITATLSASGCYKGATASYTLNVSGSSCTDVAGTVTTTDLGCSGIRLTLSGYTAGATIKWYKDGDEIEGEIGTTYTATEAGSYYAVTHNDCNKASNTVVIAAKTVSAERVVEKWYIKNGRVTPDIALWSVGEGTSLSSVAWSPENATGLTASDFYLQDGVIYLKGTSPSSNDSGADIEYTLTLTVSNGCNTTEMSDASKKIKLVHQKNTDKHVLAFVVVGTANGGFTEGIPASQTTSVPLYNEIAKNFDVQATNIKSTDDEKALKEYYSQFDILCITDYPSTGDKGSHSKSYVDAIGSLIDIRPILTMEAFVAKLSNWAAKGISGTPKSPCPRQYSMDLQCKDHEIFSGTKLVKIGEGDEAMYRVTMVDKTKADYSTKDAETECSKAYDAGGYPALQGFTFDATMLADGLLPLGLIHNGESEELQVGLERQEEMSARLMVLGIQQKAMERLTDDGQKVVINALKYLMKKNAEDIADCSNTFVGGDSEEDKSTRYNWNVASHWSGNALPDCTQKVRIVAPCVIPDGQKVHVAEVIIAPDGKYNHGSDSASGSLTIAAGGALVVEGKVEAATAPNYNTKRATSASDLVIKASSTKQGALIFDNIEGETQATVEMYSPSYWVVQEGTNKKKSYWSYVGVPIQDVPVGEFFYGAVTYLYDETSGWIRKKIGTELHAFEGIGLSLPAGNMETFYGTLASTETKEITLTYSACSGENLIGNSWTAPIQIGNFTSGDFGSGATAVVSMYKTGRDDVENNPTYTTATAENDGTVSAGQWVSIPIGLPGTTGYDGPTVIPSMQAFQVNTTSETTLTLDYDKLVRDVTIATDNLTQPMSAPKRVVKKSLDAMIRVRMSGFKTRTDLWIMEDGRFSDEFDNGWEANYIECDERSPQLYAVSEIGNMSFLALPDIEGTVLGIAPSRDGNEYLFTFHYVGNEEFYLNDLKLKKSTLISDEDNYSFMYEDGDTNRFYISRTPIDAPQTPTGVDNTHSGEVKAQKFIYNDKMYIMINGRIYSAEGQIVK